MFVCMCVCAVSVIDARVQAWVALVVLGYIRYISPYKILYTIEGKDNGQNWATVNECMPGASCAAHLDLHRQRGTRFIYEPKKPHLNNNKNNNNSR